MTKGVSGRIMIGSGGGGGGTLGDNVLAIAGTSCIAYKSEGGSFTGPGSIGTRALRLECTNADGSKTAYVKVVDGPNNDLNNFQEITQF